MDGEVHSQTSRDWLENHDRRPEANEAWTVVQPLAFSGTDSRIHLQRENNYFEIHSKRTGERG